MAVSILTPARHVLPITGLTVQEAQALMAPPRLGEPVDIDTWNQRLRTYLLACCAEKTEREFGALAKAEQAHAAAVAEHGEGVDDHRRHPALKMAWDCYAAAEEAHTEHFSKPRWNAGEAVYVTPSPSLAALVQKVEVIDKEDAWDNEETTRLLGDDIRQLAARGA